jgi:zinc transporter, ZIP family
MAACWRLTVSGWSWWWAWWPSAGWPAAPPPPAPSGSVDAPSGLVAVAQTLLRSGTIVFEVRNGGAHPVTIAQITVNDAFWPFTARPRPTIAPHRTAFVTVRYPWDAGVAYEVQFIASTGATFVTDIAATTTASATPSP